LFKNPIIDFIIKRSAQKKEELNNLTSAIGSAPWNRQIYSPCQYGIPSLNIKPAVKGFTAFLIPLLNIVFVWHVIELLEVDSNKWNDSEANKTLYITPVHLSASVVLS
jgi:hypothetical protein